MNAVAAFVCFAAPPAQVNIDNLTLIPTSTTANTPQGSHQGKKSVKLD
jgi:hypothetical protein